MNTIQINKMKIIEKRQESKPLKYKNQERVLVYKGNFRQFSP